MKVRQIVGRTIVRLAILVIAPVCAAASIGQADTTDPMGAVWSRPWLYNTLKLFNSYRVRRDGPKAALA